MLSGFLIVPILFSARQRIEAGLSRPITEYLLFTRDRALRIFPLYYVALVIALVMGTKFGSAENIDKLQGATYWLFTYTTNIYIGFVREGWLGPLSHLWTLAVEQQFYVLFPLLFIFLPTRLWFGALLVAILILIAVPVVFFSDSVLKFRVNSLSGFYAICIGGFFGLAIKVMKPNGQFPLSGFLTFVLAVGMLGQHIYFLSIGREDISLIIAPFFATAIIILIALNQQNEAVRTSGESADPGRRGRQLRLLSVPWVSSRPLRASGFRSHRAFLGAPFPDPSGHHCLRGHHGRFRRLLSLFRTEIPGAQEASAAGIEG